MSAAALVAPALSASPLAAGADAYAGPLGLVLVIVLGIATALLVRNMDKRLKRLPREFAPPGQDQHPDAGPTPPEPDR